MFLLRDVITRCEQSFDSLVDVLPVQAYLEMKLGHATELIEVKKGA